MARRPDWEECKFGMKPGLYGDEIAKSLGVKKAPVDERAAAEFMGYEIEEVSVGETEAELEKFKEKIPTLKKLFHKVCAILDRTLNCIFINKEYPRVQKRTGGFHEIGHEGCPWHRGTNFACADSCLSPENHKQMEHEAFECGAAVQMPTFLFLPDVMSAPIGEKAVKNLASAYIASLEVAGMRYAKINPGRVAVIVAEPVPTLALQTSINGQLELFQALPLLPPPDKAALWLCEKTYRGDPIRDGMKFPMQVRHARTS